MVHYDIEENYLRGMEGNIIVSRYPSSSLYASYPNCIYRIVGNLRIYKETRCRTAKRYSCSLCEIQGYNIVNMSSNKYAYYTHINSFYITENAIIDRFSIPKSMHVILICII